MTPVFRTPKTFSVYTELSLVAAVNLHDKLSGVDIRFWSQIRSAWGEERVELCEECNRYFRG